MTHGDYLSPRLVALAKDSALNVFFKKWENSITFNFIKDAMANDIDISDKVIIREHFADISSQELSRILEEAYLNSLELIKTTLKFVGRVNDSYSEKIEW